jgi:F0F1-type ATP synthase membrane subunit b/b'
MGTLIALKGILLNSIPTFCLVWILYFYVSRMFLTPLDKVLAQRRGATEGMRRAAEDRVSLAEQKTAAYQEALRSSSAEIYRQQEQDRQKAVERRAESLLQARARAEERIKQARQELEQEAEAAKKQLGQESEQLAQWITRSILELPTATPAAGPTGAPDGAPDGGRSAASL